MSHWHQYSPACKNAIFLNKNANVRRAKDAPAPNNKGYDMTQPTLLPLPDKTLFAALCLLVLQVLLAAPVYAQDQEINPKLRVTGKRSIISRPTFS